MGPKGPSESCNNTTGRIIGNVINPTKYIQWADPPVFMRGIHGVEPYPGAFPLLPVVLGMITIRLVEIALGAIPQRPSDALINKNKQDNNVYTPKPAI